MTKPIAILILFAIVLARFAYTDRREYRRFKALAESRDRQRTYAAWLAKSFFAFGFGAIASLIWLNQLSAVWELPSAFKPLLKPLRDNMAGERDVIDFLVGFGGAVAAGPDRDVCAHAPAPKAR